MIARPPPPTFSTESQEVLYTDRAITCIDREFLDELKSMAGATKRKRIRICAHPDSEDTLHEMLIVLHRDTYVPPHAHHNKSESYHMIEGALDIVLFDDAGTPQTVVPLSADKGIFYYRLSEPRFHTVLPGSEWVVFHETTNGPFRRDETTYAAWAPGNGDAAASQQAYLDKLRTLF